MAIEMNMVGMFREACEAIAKSKTSEPIAAAILSLADAVHHGLGLISDRLDEIRGELRSTDFSAGGSEIRDGLESVASSIDTVAARLALDMSGEIKDGLARLALDMSGEIKDGLAAVARSFDLSELSEPIEGLADAVAMIGVTQDKPAPTASKRPAKRKK